MRDRKHGRKVPFTHEDDLIGEVIDWQLPDMRIVDPENGTTRMRKPLEQFERLVNLIEKSRCQLGIALAVPPGRIEQITFRSRPQPDQFHRDRTSLRISARAARQSS